MARARQRRRKHRGTQAGTVQRRGRTSRPSALSQRPDPRERRRAALERPPNWRSAVNRAIIAAGVFFVVLALLLQRSLVEALSLSAFMLAIYIPMGYAMDSLRYRLIQRRRARQSERQSS
jgi:hypothetical protein